MQSRHSVNQNNRKVKLFNLLQRVGMKLS